MFISANCGIRADSRIAWRSCPLAMVSLCPSQWIHFWLQSGISRAWIRTTFASTVLPSCYSWLFSKFCHQRVATCNQGSVHTWHLSRRRRGRKRSLSRLIIHIQIDFSIAWSQPGFSILSFGSGSIESTLKRNMIWGTRKCQEFENCFQQFASWLIVKKRVESKTHGLASTRWWTWSLASIQKSKEEEEIRKTYAGVSSQSWDLRMMS